MRHAGRRIWVRQARVGKVMQGMRVAGVGGMQGMWVGEIYRGWEAGMRRGRISDAGGEGEKVCTRLRRHACGGERVKETCRRCGRQARAEAGMAGRGTGGCVRPER